MTLIGFYQKEKGIEKNLKDTEKWAWFLKVIHQKNGYFKTLQKEKRITPSILLCVQENCTDIRAVFAEVKLKLTMKIIQSHLM